MGIDIHRLLEAMPKLEASDLHIKAGSPPLYRIDGELRPVEHPPIDPAEVMDIAEQMMNQQKRALLAEQGTVDFAYSITGVSRYRVNVFHQRSQLSIAIRMVKLKIPAFKELNLPADVMQGIASNRDGLVLVTGVTGSGKSTTLASMIQHINDTRSEHIITIEDPIEYAYADNMSIVNQIEIGTDVPSFEIALKHVLRQDPDAILIGEMRDVLTVRTALMATETGHLVFGTLHTSDCRQTLNRVLHFFDTEDEKLILEQLSLSLKAVISQRLLQKAGGVGRIPALEIMVQTPIISKLIREGRITELKQAIQNGEGGMRTFNQHLVDLVRNRQIDFEEGLRYADDEAAFRRNVKGVYSEGDKTRLVGI